MCVRLISTRQQVHDDFSASFVESDVFPMRSDFRDDRFGYEFGVVDAVKDGHQDHVTVFFLADFRHQTFETLDDSL